MSQHWHMADEPYYYNTPDTPCFIVPRPSLSRPGKVPAVLPRVSRQMLRRPRGKQSTQHHKWNFGGVTHASRFDTVSANLATLELHPQFGDKLLEIGVP